ncbi:hypothetical protein ACVWXB_007466 [Streptomyces sp. TE12347]
MVQARAQHPLEAGVELGQGATSRFCAEVTCIANNGRTFVIYGDWVHEGVSYATCSLNGSVGVAHIGWKFGNKG